MVTHQHHRTQLALGTVQWGQDYGIANTAGQPPMTEVARMLTRAYARGVRVLDTARAYGESEETLGVLLPPESDWRVVTKLSPSVADAISRKDAVHVSELSLELSKQALERDSLDTLLLHRASHRTAFDGAIWDMLRQRKEAGGIRRLGISAGSPDEAFAALEDKSVEVIQVAASLFDQRLARAGFFRMARERRVEVFIRSVFLQGVALMHPDDLPPTLARLRPASSAIRNWALSNGTSVVGTYLGYAGALGADFVLVGCETSDQLDLNLAAWDGGIDEKRVLDFAASLPALEEEWINPARWAHP